jgi:hypothetical protein
MASKTILLRRHDVVVEEAIDRPHLERGLRIGRNEPHRPGMMESQMLDDDGRLDHRAIAIHQHGKAFHRPQRLELGHGLRIAQHVERERRGVLVERDQRLLAVGRERVGIERRRHRCLAP